jgi:hypothetical protein
LKVRKVYTNGGDEALYEVLSQTSYRGEEYFKTAVLMAQNERYDQALKMALLSQSLGIEQDISGFIQILKKKIGLE